MKDVRRINYSFVYEKKFKEYEKDRVKLEHLQEEYREIGGRLEELTKKGEISEFVKQSLMEMIRQAAEKIAEKYESVRKGVTSAVSGKILEYEAKTIWRSGYTEGESNGKREGKLEGMREGKREGKLEGMREGKREGRLEAYIDMVQAGLLTLSKAAERLNMKVEELEKYLQDAGAVKQE